MSSRRTFLETAGGATVAAFLGASSEAQTRRPGTTKPAATPTPIPTEVISKSFVATKKEAELVAESKPKGEVSIVSDPTKLVKWNQELNSNAAKFQQMMGQRGALGEFFNGIGGLAGAGLNKLKGLAGRGDKDERGADFMVHDVVQAALNKGRGVVLVYAPKEQALEMEKKIAETSGLGTVEVINVDAENPKNEDFKKHFDKKGRTCVVWSPGTKDIYATSDVFMTSMATEEGFMAALKKSPLATAAQAPSPGL